MKTTPPAGDGAQHDNSDNNKAPAMSSHRALLTLAAFLALPLGVVYMMSHCSHFSPSTSSLAQYQTGYRHPHGTMHAKHTKQAKHAEQSMLENIAMLMAEASASPPIPNMQMRFCSGADLRDCASYAYTQGCTKIEEQRVLSIAEPGMFEGRFSACTVYRRGVQDCETKEEDSFKHVKEFVVNWDAQDEDEELASNGVVPLLQKDWISDIGSFKCR
ncbi:uncharacterized protein CC84DRAFT_456341 [Paraphaeosphaeria sporulosa]|uniref:Uncharacterized protein n=1 Tax=Paraphaeosphaeria sporulosa TaxID=1460663 RepID=A0A177CQY2_9PLEO|nr:uncharacterized protein CC84DRAFT_456341 [Paraphaeosphaeria sporulosa]OAG09915.1 hypothetical protein CC84DRAFT_456341 [Paraphaeosphaeria sporulosa]